MLSTFLVVGNLDLFYNVKIGLVSQRALDKFFRLIFYFKLVITGLDSAAKSASTSRRPDQT